MKSKYKISLDENGIYEVIELDKVFKGTITNGYYDYTDDEVVFKGSISDCYSWIEAKKKGYLQ